MLDNLDSFLTTAKRAHWKVVRRKNVRKSSESFRIVGSVLQRYWWFPYEYASFVAEVAMCINSAQNVWFNCAQEFNNESVPTPFPWNYIEQNKLRACGKM